LRFVLEALQLLWIHRGGKRQHLQGDAAGQRNLYRLVNYSHAAPADLADDAKVAEFAQLGSRGRNRGLRQDDGIARTGGAPEGGQHVQRREELAKLLGKFGMSVAVYLDIQRFACMELVRYLLDDLGEDQIGTFRRAQGPG